VSSQRLVIYARVSQIKQEASLETQIEILQGYSELYGHTVVKVFEEAQSGKSASDRKVLQEALQFISDGHADGMLIYKLDRLGRSVSDVLHIIEKHFTSKVRHIYDMRVDTSSLMGKCFFTITAAFAELERGQIIQRTRDGLKHRRETGMTYTGRLYGVKGGKDQPMVSCPQEQAVIDRIITKRSLKQSFREIADDLQMSGFPPPRETRSGNVCAWHKETVRRIWNRHSPHSKELSCQPQSR